MLKIKRYLKLYRDFFKMDIRRIGLYRANLLTSSLGYLLDSLATFFSIWLILNQVGSIYAWGISEMFALFTYTLFLLSIWEFFFVNTLEIPFLIFDGELDIFLVRPVNDLFQFIIFELDEESIFEIIVSFLMFLGALASCQIVAGPGKILIFILATFSALMGLEAIYLTISSTAFWFTSTEGLKSIIYQILQLNRYPLEIYPNFVKIIMTIIPFGLYGYYPLSLLLFPQSSWTATLYVILSGPVFLLIAYFGVWKVGLRHYTSAAG
ncbi:ABC transporter permease [Lapidilactobacillus luobeiensis]|uniref:ABC transporter permease n=1 Tax=Lapidilactobacillus luobeiensis TaxID=2950371 RepID=UPI0021C42D27|nr:ABC-2 family transporter protein [Lapidilactobacillus luobeiensis]